MATKRSKLPRSTGPRILFPADFEAEVTRLQKLIDAGGAAGRKAKDQLRRLRVRQETLPLEAMRSVRAELVGELVARFFEPKLGARVRALLLSQTHAKEDALQLTSWVILYLQINKVMSAHSKERALPNLNNRAVFNMTTRMFESMPADMAKPLLEMMKNDDSNLGDPALREAVLGMSDRK